MKKYIHYCWFGDKPFPKLAEKCLKSWQRYLPDFTIMKWSEENVDLDECPFIKEAYENKKWAFVADYARAKALKEYGGIYFDTDMEVIKDITKLLETGNTFLGIEDTGYVAVGVWYENKENALLPTQLLETYKAIPHFEIENISNYAIPKLLSSILDPFGLKKASKEIQILGDGIYIYPREYFYPYSYDRTNNIFTDNTCMIHYYDASWIPLKERIETNMVRKIGRKKTFAILHYYRKTKDIIRKCAKVVLFPVVIYRNNKRKKQLIDDKYLERIDNTIKSINVLAAKNVSYIVFHNREWLGVTSATKELFENTVDCGEIYRKQDVKRIGDAITNTSIKQVVFSSFAKGYKDLAKYLKEEDPSLKLKTYWHGSHSQVLDSYGFERNLEIINLHKKGIISVMATCKESLLNFYLKEGYKAKFITNKVTTSVKPLKKKNSKEIRIGLYAAKCDDWRKNMFTQIAAASLIDNAVIDMVPLNEEAIEFANLVGVKIEGVDNSLKREELIARMSLNDINLYVTFSECAPMLPLESLEMGVPCITGNNHHYFKDGPLEEYLVVNNEENPLEIKEKIDRSLASKDEVLKLYKKFSKDNLEQAKKDIEDFLRM